MGKRAAEIEYELERQRRALTDRLQNLQQRAGGDLEGLRENALGQADRTARGVERAGDHPVPLVAGALGTGLALGLATGGKPHDNRKDKNARLVPPAQPSGKTGAEEPGGGGLFDRARQAAVGFVETEAASIAQDFWDGFRGNSREPRKPAGERFADAAVEVVPKPIRSAWDNLASQRQHREDSGEPAAVSRTSP